MSITPLPPQAPNPLARVMPSAAAARVSPVAATVSRPIETAAQPGLLTQAYVSAQHGLAAALVALGNVPLLRRMGYAVYGTLCSGKAGGPAIGNEGTLTKKLIRGAQPSQAGIATLKAQGVDTVINLRAETDWEAAAVKQAGMKSVYIPEAAIGSPTNEQAVQFLKTVTDPAMGKVFFHCQHGADRTGAMAAVYRIAAQGWSADKAIAEMPKYHFHSGIEDAKVTFVKQFEGFWKGLSQSAKQDVLHAVVH